MPNKSYVKGYRKEWKIMNEFKEKGFISFRSAGSHSPIDVIGIDTKEHVIYLIQSKNFKDMNPDRLTRLQDEYKFLSGIYRVVFKVA